MRLFIDENDQIVVQPWTSEEEKELRQWAADRSLVKIEKVEGDGEVVELI